MESEASVAWPAAAVDMSGPDGSLALQKQPGGAVSIYQRPLRPRDGQAFLSEASAFIAAEGLEAAGIRAWIVGRGPGSYSGVRSAIAFAAGAARGAPAALLSIPSHMVLAASVLPPEGGLAAAIYPARGGGHHILRIRLGACPEADIHPIHSLAPEAPLLIREADRLVSWHRLDTATAPWNGFPGLPLHVPERFPAALMFDPRLLPFLAPGLPEPIYLGPAAERPSFYLRPDCLRPDSTRPLQGLSHP